MAVTARGLKVPVVPPPVAAVASGADVASGAVVAAAAVVAAGSRRLGGCCRCGRRCCLGRRRRRGRRTCGCATATCGENGGDQGDQEQKYCLAVGLVKHEIVLLVLLIEYRNLVHEQGDQKLSISWNSHLLRCLSAICAYDTPYRRYHKDTDCLLITNHDRVNFLLSPHGGGRSVW